MSTTPPTHSLSEWTWASSFQRRSPETGAPQRTVSTTHSVSTKLQTCCPRSLQDDLGPHTQLRTKGSTEGNDGGSGTTKPLLAPDWAVRRKHPIWEEEMAPACSSRGPGLDSQHPPGASQLFTALVPRGLMPSSGLCWHSAHTR